jgi:hypothetical protein
MPICIASKANGAPCTFKARAGFQTCGHHKSQELLTAIPDLNNNEFFFCQNYIDLCNNPHRPGFYCCDIHSNQEAETRRRIQAGIHQIDYYNPRAQPVVFIHFINNLLGIDEDEPIVFERDPEGDVNLAAFAVDNQNVHRSSVQNETQAAIQKILAVPLLPKMMPHKANSTYFEFLIALTHNDTTDKDLVIANNVLREECKEDVLAFGTTYQNVFDHVWSYIQRHQDKAELVKRLREEVVESKGMCSNGKITRLVNSLQGFMDGLEPPVSKMEIFQHKIAKLMDIPESDRTVEANKLFTEFNIPADQHEAWLAPLM